MAFCQACQRETVQYGELLPSGMVNRCGHDDCRAPIDGRPLPRPNSAVPELPRTVEASPFGELANARPGMVLPGRPSLPAPPPSPPRTAAVIAQAPALPLPPPPPPVAPVGVGPRSLELLLPELRARHGEVRRQLAAMAALQVEEACLARMLAAFDDAPSPESP